MRALHHTHHLREGDLNYHCPVRITTGGERGFLLATLLENGGFQILPVLCGLSLGLLLRDPSLALLVSRPGRLVGYGPLAVWFWFGSFFGLGQACLFLEGRFSFDGIGLVVSCRASGFSFLIFHILIN